METAPAGSGQPAPYDDDIDPRSGTILYHYCAGSIDQADKPGASRRVQ